MGSSSARRLIFTDYEQRTLVVGWSGVNVVWWICEAGIHKDDQARTGGLGYYGSQSGLITDRIGVVMILPQVHLRKPCYDLFFL